MRPWSIAVSLVPLFFAALPAAAEVPMHGSFLAGAACPAVQSIRKGSNPGAVRLEPRHTYRLVSANNDPATHYLLIVPGASPERRWVEAGCGQIAGQIAGQVPGPAATPAAPPATTPAPLPPRAGSSPRHFVLSISWEPGFCAGMSGKPECRAETPGGFEASHFTLHGLWPDPREYCGVPASAIAADKASRWDELPAVALGASTRAHLAEAMPGTRSLLERHEWLKHGTCAGVGADAYFSRALGLLGEVNASPVQTLFAGHVGQGLTLAAIRAAFDQGFGVGAGERIRLACSRARRITEITVGLDGDVMGNAALSTLMATARPTSGGCDQGSVTAVP